MTLVFMKKYFIFFPPVQLAKDHMKSVQKLEKHKQKELKERQETFQSAFDQDVDFYRTHGRLERKLQFFFYLK